MKPGDAVCVRVDGGYSHEFTTAQVHYFLEQEYGADYRLHEPARSSPSSRTTSSTPTAWPRWRRFSPKIQVLRDLQREFQRQTGVHDYSAQRRRVARASATRVAREQIIEPGDFIQATDSHTCMGGALNALAYGVGATEYAALVHSGLHVRRGAGVDPLRADRRACAAASPPRT